MNGEFGDKWGIDTLRAEVFDIDAGGVCEFWLGPLRVYYSYYFIYRRSVYVNFEVSALEL